MMTTRIVETGERILSVLGYPDVTVCVGLIDDREIAKLHQQWFGDPSPTNVISLEYDLDESGLGLLGEIYVSVEFAAREAAAAGVPLDYRVAWLMMHGLLHICGYEHVDVPADEVRRMEHMEEQLDRDWLAPLWGIL